MNKLEGYKRRTIEHCESVNDDGTVLLSWPCKTQSTGYIITKITDLGEEEILVQDIFTTRYLDDSLGSDKVKYRVETYSKRKAVVKDKESLFGSLEQAIIKGNTNTLVSDYILENYDNLLVYIEKLPHIDKTLTSLLLNDVWLTWSKKEKQGSAYSAYRVGKNGEYMTVEQVVENTLKAYAKNPKYTNKYNNKEKHDGIEVEVHSVSMLEEREEGSDNNHIVAKASMKKMTEVDSPLDDLVEICTLKEDLEYVLEATKDYTISARKILDNFSTLLEVVSDDEESGHVIGEDVIRNMNKTLFSEYRSDLSMIDMFSRIFAFMNKDITLFTQVYETLCAND